LEGGDDFKESGGDLQELGAISIKRTPLVGKSSKYRKNTPRSGGREDIESEMDEEVFKKSSGGREMRFECQNNDENCWEEGKR
jgi:hypothetical protein